MIVTREKVTYCGSGYKEVDIFNAPDRKRFTGRGKRRSVSAPAQKNLNDKRALRYLVQLINANFKDFRDSLMHLTYDDENLPESVEAAEGHFKNFIKRINYRLKKRGMKNAKYILITSDTSTKTGELVRVHHHVIISCGLSRDELFMLWKPGRINVDPLQGRKKNYADLAAYLAKNARQKKKWIASLGLCKPKEVSNDNKYTPRKLEKIARQPFDREYWEKVYPGWEIIQSDDGFEAEFNEMMGWRIILKLRKKERSAA